MCYGCNSRVGRRPGSNYWCSALLAAVESQQEGRNYDYPLCVCLCVRLHFRRGRSAFSCLSKCPRHLLELHSPFSNQCIYYHVLSLCSFQIRNATVLKFMFLETISVFQMRNGKFIEYRTQPAAYHLPRPFSM